MSLKGTALRLYSFSLCFTVLVAEGVNGSSNLEDLFQGKMRKLPTTNGSLNVFIGIYVESFGKFQSNDMSFDVDLYLYSSWRDPALSHKNKDLFLVNDKHAKNQLWLPDLYFTNARSATFHDVTIPNFNMFIAQDGTVSYSTRVTLNVACALNLVDYPMDTQMCSIRVQSYAYIANQVTVRWFHKDPVQRNPEIGLPEFAIEQMTADYCLGEYKYAITERSYRQDNFSCLDGKIYLRRSIGYHLVQSYIPTGVIVVISWVSFWIDMYAVPARVTLSFTTLLSLSTLGNGLRYGLPQLSYAKAIDFWFGACLFFVFCSLLEFAIVNTVVQTGSQKEKFAESLRRKVLKDDAPDRARRGTIAEKGGYTRSHSIPVKVRIYMPNQPHNGHHRDYDKFSTEDEESSLIKTKRRRQLVQFKGRRYPRKSLTLNPTTNDQCDELIDKALLEAEEAEAMAMSCMKKALMVDYWSRYIFPTAFFCFNVFYWSWYLWLKKKLL